MNLNCFKRMDISCKQRIQILFMAGNSVNFFQLVFKMPSHLAIFSRIVNLLWESFMLFRWWLRKYKICQISDHIFMHGVLSLSIKQTWSFWPCKTGRSAEKIEDYYYAKTVDIRSSIQRQVLANFWLYGAHLQLLPFREIACICVISLTKTTHLT